MKKQNSNQQEKGENKRQFTSFDWHKNQKDLFQNKQNLEFAEILYNNKE